MENYIQLVSMYLDDIENFKYKDLDEFKLLTLKNAITNLGIFYNIYQSYELDSETLNEKADLIINLYGLLQALFVSIDSLYELSFALLNNKNQVNINQNKVLHEIKYVRNDVVGHPVNRVYYKSEAKGISFIDFDTTDYQFLNYTTYKFIDNKKSVINRKIDMFKTSGEFFLEAKLILEEVKNLYSKKIDFEKILLDYDKIFLLNTTKEKSELIKKIKSQLKEKNIFNKYSNNRLLWRLNLLRDIILFKTDNVDMKYLFHVAEQIQKNKIKLMITKKEDKIDFNKLLDMDDKTDILQMIYKNKSILPYLKNLHDKNHPHFSIDLNKIIENTKNVVRLNLFFKEFMHISKTNNLVPYSIGYILKNLSLIRKEVKQ